MTAGLAAYLLLPLFGLATWRLEAVRRLDLAGRLAVAGATGALVVASTLSVLSIAGIRWGPAWIFGVPGLVAAIAIWSTRKVEIHPRSKPSLVFVSGSGLFLGLLVYGVMTARLTCGDLLYHWGPKGVRMFHEGGVTVSFLAGRLNQFMHPDYPLLLPLLLGWSHAVSGPFSWFAAVFLSILCLIASAAIVRSMSGDDAAALSMFAALGYCAAIGFAPGGADLLLVLFGTLAVSALTFLEDGRSQTTLAAIGALGAATAKIEGITIVIAIVLTVILVERKLVKAVVLGAPGIAVAVGWIAITKKYGITDGARSTWTQLHIDVLPDVLRAMLHEGSYVLFWVPWILPAGLLLCGRPRRAAFPLTFAILTIAAIVYLYLHNPDAPAWVVASARRVLLTPLAALYIAAAAAGSPSGNDPVGEPPAV